MDKTQLISEIESLISEGQTIEGTSFNGYGVKLVNGPTFRSWRPKVLALFSCFLPTDHPFVVQIESNKESTHANVVSSIGVLENVKEYLEKGIISIKPIKTTPSEEDVLSILSHFHSVARQLRNRHDSRSTLIIHDEYDVQDLLHALLYSRFSDVRAEEWTPSYAGKSARMDFLIKDIKCVIEVKMTRNTLTEKEIGDQLLIDIERYKSHPDCKTLICFIYDPEEIINNPKGLIKDLESSHNGFVKVIVQPSY